MLFRLTADAVLLLHFGYIVFVMCGAALALRWRWMPLLHLPAAAWGFFVELSGSICPLTPLENALRFRAGQAGYARGFIEHYLINIIYPPGLTRDMQAMLALLVVLVNCAIYAWVIFRSHAAGKRKSSPT